MDRLLPCPHCGFAENDEEQFAINPRQGEQIVCPKCLMSGPSAKSFDFAIAAWNALPRTPRWTEYDGTEQTLPPKGSFVFTLLLYGHGWLIRGDRERLFWAVGDKWWPIPEGGE